MTPNELLLWLSARKQGSWPQFRGAVETLDLAASLDEGGQDISIPIHQRVRFNLERLGHLEFGAAGCEDGWRVVPPTLALSQHGDGVTGVLCGARTPKLMDGIRLGSRSLTYEHLSQAECPSIVRVLARESDPLIDLAQRQNVLVQLDTPTALLSHIPPVDDIRDYRREALPITGKDWDVKQFIIERKVMKWHPITIQDANAPAAQGLFRFTRFQVPQYFLRDGHETIKLPGAIGKYRVLSQRRRRVLRYDRLALSLTLPAILRPPLLTERALILCSGFPPSLSFPYKRPTLTYRHIPEDIAGMTAEVLRQDLV